MRLLSLILCSLLCVSAAQAQTFGGAKIGDDASVVAGFSGPVSLSSQGNDRYAKFRMPDGHDLSLTTRNYGPIIYMEANRNRAVPLASDSGMTFGVTTRGSLRQTIGNDGFTYASRTQVGMPGGAGYFLSYELANQLGVIATFAFFLSEDRYPLGADAALLDGIIVAQQWYLDEIWGPNKTVSPGYNRLTMQY